MPTLAQGRPTRQAKMTTEQGKNREMGDDRADARSGLEVGVLKLDGINARTHSGSASCSRSGCHARTAPVGVERASRKLAVLALADALFPLLQPYSEAIRPSLFIYLGKLQRGQHVDVELLEIYV